MQLLFVILASISFWVGVVALYFGKLTILIPSFIAFIVLSIISEIVGKRAKKRTEEEEEKE